MNYPQQIDECPICSAPLKVSIDTIDTGVGGGPICEHYEVCPNGCYDYQFAYGYTQVFVTLGGHHVQFGWSYSDDAETVKAETDAIDTLIEAARRIRQGEDQARRPEEPR